MKYNKVNYVIGNLFGFSKKYEENIENFFYRR